MFVAEQLVSHLNNERLVSFCYIYAGVHGYEDQFTRISLGVRYVFKSECSLLRASFIIQLLQSYTR